MADTAELAAPSVVGANAQAELDADKPTPKPRHPSDFDSEHEFLEHVRTLYHRDLEADQNNREESTLDFKFVAGDQWDAGVKSRRDRASKPTLTINRLPAFVAQLIGNRRLSDTGIKIIPDTGGKKKIAEIREGLIRSIQKNSRAQYVYDKTFEHLVIGGIGNFQINLDYAHDDVFEQDIRINAIPNPLAVVWDQASVEPTGSDARHVFVVDNMPRAAFKDKYPKAEAGEWDSNMTLHHGWDSADSVQVVSFWRMRSRPRTVGLFPDGSVLDITEVPLELWFDRVVRNADGEPMVREVQRKYAQMYLCTSRDILRGPYELPIHRVPVFRALGWELFVENERKRWGFVRFLRDPQRLHNYWRSAVAEKLVGSTKAKWTASSAAVEGREAAWRAAHLSDDPLLIWNAESGAPPERVPPVEIEAALIQEAGMAAQDIRDVSNLHEASLGLESNEVSGRAIMARQRVGEVGTVIYQDNLNAAIEEAGQVINQLIPFVYDTPRVIKVLGTDYVKEEQVKINFEDDPESVDITLGKYAVSAVTGPSYTTRRVEAREEMMAMVNAMPQAMQVAADLIIENQDWPGSDEIARRMRMTLPPGVISEKDLTDEERQQQASAAQAQQEQQQLQMQAASLEMQGKQADTELKQAQARKAAAEALRAEAEAIEAQAKADLARANAAKAIADIERDRLKVSLDVANSLSEATQPTA